MKPIAAVLLIAALIIQPDYVRIPRELVSGFMHRSATQYNGFQRSTVRGVGVVQMLRCRGLTMVVRFELN